MPSERLVVIGGVAAGMSAASRARRRNPHLEIVVLEKGRYVSYGACGLPYYVSGRVARAEELVVYDAEFFREKRDIDVRLEHEAVEIEPGRKRVAALDRGARVVELAFDKLILTTGGAPQTTLPGADLAGVFTVNDLTTTIRLREFIDTQKPREAVVVGSGYIGLEMVDALAARGCRVTLLERGARLLEGFGEDINQKLIEILDRHGVRHITGAEVNAVVGAADGTVEAVSFGGTESATAELVILATGIRPRTRLAEAAGIALGPTGAIAADDRMQTSASGIYAAGDCVETTHLVSGRPVYFPLGTTANKQGLVAGENATGGNARFPGIVGTLVTKVFELELGRTGLSVAEARASGFHPDEVTITSISRAKYFDGKPLTVSLVWERDGGRLLGCQMAGEEGVAKRIDAAAVALTNHMRVPEMLHLDLSYAPPFAPVWDPLLVAVRQAVKKLGGHTE